MAAWCSSTGLRSRPAPPHRTCESLAPPRLPWLRGAALMPGAAPPASAPSASQASCRRPAARSELMRLWVAATGSAGAAAA